MFLFNEPLKIYGSLYFTTFSVKPIPLQALELHRLSWLSPFSKAFIKIYYFWNFSKLCSLALQNSHYSIFWTTSATEFFRNIFQSFFEDTIITTNFLKCHLYNTSFIEINTLFIIFNNKGLGNFKVRQNHSIHKGMDAG